MNTKSIRHILVIRFRQIGDSVLATSLLNTLKKNFPDAQIDFVLNKGIAPLFEHHPAIDRILCYDKNEVDNLFLFIVKTWNIMHSTQYDVIIDMRSTFKTLLFSFFSLKTCFRIGQWKRYNRFIQNYRMNRNGSSRSMIDRDLLLASPLDILKPLVYDHQFTLHLTRKEDEDYQQYMKEEGIYLEKPIILIAATTKLSYKAWEEAKIAEVIRRIICTYPDIQLIFNYAPGQEEIDARHLYDRLGQDKHIFIDLQAHSLRELCALTKNVDFFFGNEGGARHIAQAMGIPSFVVCSPKADKKVWIPQNEISARGLCPTDIDSEVHLLGLTYQQQYDLISPDHVWKILKQMLDSVFNFS